MCSEGPNERCEVEKEREEDSEKTWKSEGAKCSEEKRRRGCKEASVSLRGAGRRLNGRDAVAVGTWRHLREAGESSILTVCSVYRPLTVPTL